MQSVIRRLYLMFLYAECRRFSNFETAWASATGLFAITAWALTTMVLLLVFVAPHAPERPSDGELFLLYMPSMFICFAWFGAWSWNTTPATLASRPDISAPWYLPVVAAVPLRDEPCGAHHGPHSTAQLDARFARTGNDRRLELPRRRFLAQHRFCPVRHSATMPPSFTPAVMSVSVLA
jgi:hypothetical protein